MPLGGANILWNENAPADTDNAGAGDDDIRSTKSSLRNALGSEHNWPSGGGASTGYHLYGSARAFYDVQSNVSSSGTDGRLMLTSDTSRLFGAGSGGTVLLGGPAVLMSGTFPTGGPPQRAYWSTEFGTATYTVGPSVSVSFGNSGFSGLPYLLVSQATTANPFGNTDFAVIQVEALNTTGFKFSAKGFVSNGSVNATINWLSIGTRTL